MFVGAVSLYAVSCRCEGVSLSKAALVIALVGVLLSMIAFSLDAHMRVDAGLGRFINVWRLCGLVLIFSSAVMAGADLVVEVMTNTL